jgi:DNA-binding MarR family transcriptional regulator
LSRDSQQTRAEVLGALARELRQFQGLSASFFRAAAAQIGMTVTDMQVIDLLASAGPMTAGQLADLTGLTTGAITGMLNRLEEAGRVRRERDPADGRRVIVRLVPDQDTMREIGPLFDSIGKAWEDLAAHYDDEQIAFLLEFLQRSNALSRAELAQLQAAPESKEGIYSAPMGDLTSGRLVVPTGISRLSVRADSNLADLYQARFEGPVPDVKVKEGVITIRYPRLLGVVDWRKRAAEVLLSAAIPWQILVQGGASEIIADLGRLNLVGLEVKGGMSMIRLDLPAPSSVVPIRISGGASEITIRSPVGVPAKVHLKGWASALVFDEQRFSNLGNDVRLHSPDYEGTTPGYDIEVASSASTISITSE